MIKFTWYRIELQIRGWMASTGLFALPYSVVAGASSDPRACLKEGRKGKLSRRKVGLGMRMGLRGAMVS